jgi:hypothetical protein
MGKYALGLNVDNIIGRFALVKNFDITSGRFFIRIKF